MPLPRSAHTRVCVCQPALQVVPVRLLTACVSEMGERETEGDGHGVCDRHHLPSCCATTNPSLRRLSGVRCVGVRSMPPRPGRCRHACMRVSETDPEFTRGRFRIYLEK
jgi:hypothetical protein